MAVASLFTNILNSKTFLNCLKYLFPNLIFSAGLNFPYFLKFSLYCIFSIIIQSPQPSLPPAIATLLSMSMSPLSFLLNSSSLSPSPPPPPLAVLCSPSRSLSLFGFLVQFVHQIPHMSEIIWYLSFSEWQLQETCLGSGSKNRRRKKTIPHSLWT